MSQAIEKAVVVLILVSEKYKTSPACRAGKLSYDNLRWALIRHVEQVSCHVVV